MLSVKTHPEMRKTRLSYRQWGLLILAGLPLLILHLGLLIERALHQETLDPVVVLRWSLAVALLVVLKRGARQFRSLRSPALGIAAILIFAMIHLPVAAPEPSLPLAATSLGLALSLAVVDRLGGSLGFSLRGTVLAGPAASAWGPIVSRDTLKDRAPPTSR